MRMSTERSAARSAFETDSGRSARQQRAVRRSFSPRQDFTLLAPCCEGYSRLMRNFCLRRVYDAKNCSIRGADAATWIGFSQPAGAFTLEVGANGAPKPGLPLPVGNSDDLVRGKPSTRRLALHTTLSGTPYAGPITEFMCWVDDVDEVTEDLRSHCRELLDLFAVAVGAGVSRQFLAVDIGEDEWRLEPDGQWRCVVSRPVSLIDAPAPSHSELAARTLDWVTGRRLEPRILSGGILPWLLRAWRETDPVSRFLALFIPIEMVLAGYRGDTGVTASQIERIKAAITATQEGDASDLCRLVDTMAGKMAPPLASRFEVMARALSPSTAVADTAAFRKFNGMRNALVHRGQASVQTQAHVGAHEAIQLQDLAERYVFLSLFPAASTE